MATYNVLYLAPELFPFAKVGGLADVAGALPKTLKDMDHDVRVFIPKYKVIKDRKYNLREVIRLRDIEVPLGNETYTVSVKSGFVPDSKVQAYFLEYKPFFDRADIYVDPKTGKGFEDDAARFALFSRAALETLKVLFWQPDLIHVNDWPSALTPYFLKTAYKDDEFFQNTKTVLTIHNLAYQGEFPAEVVPQIDGETFDENHTAWNKGKFNFLKAGIRTADLITTVSPAYAKEILSDKEAGAGLADELKKRKDDLYGVLNGIDVCEWNPEEDDRIAEKYGPEDLSGKQACRKALIEEMELEADDGTMVMGMIGRLVEQKGIDLLLEHAEDVMKQPVSLAILGTGDKEIEKALQELAKKYPGRIGLKLGFDNGLAHRIEAGADAFLMPSRFEPCGLNQLYSLQYGTPPIVHATGGLSDTVTEFKKGEGNGFVFEKYDGRKMVAAIKRAVDTFEDKDAWKTLMLNGMNEDHSWESSAKKLVEVYGQAVGEPVA